MGGEQSISELGGVSASLRGAESTELENPRGNAVLGEEIKIIWRRQIKRLLFPQPL